MKVMKQFVINNAFDGFAKIEKADAYLATQSGRETSEWTDCKDFAYSVTSAVFLIAFAMWLATLRCGNLLGLIVIPSSILL